MNEIVPHYRKVLEEALLKRVERNPRYSLRSFARALEIEPGALSKILAGKRFLTEKLANRIFQALGLDDQEQAQFLHSLASTKKESGVGRMSPALKRALNSKSLKPSKALQGEVFRFIADWYHYAILELTHLPKFRPNSKWIAARLQITPAEASLAWQRLKELELVVESEGRWKKSDSWIDTSDKSKTSGAHKLRQRQILDKSIHSLENHPLSIRNHSSYTLPIDPQKIPEAKNRIQNFMRELGQYLSDGKKEQVYELTVNLFPLQEIKEKENAKQ